MVKKMNRKELSEVLFMFGEIYNKDITEGIIGVYFDIFKDYSANEFKKAAYNVIKTHKFTSIPTPAHILEYIEGTSDDKALVAWHLARQAVVDIGYYDSPKFKNQIISNCIDAEGGWQEFCSIKTDNLPFAEKRFLDLYRIFIKRGCKPIELVGFHNANNRLKGYNENVKKPVLIGGKKVRELKQ